MKIGLRKGSISLSAARLANWPGNYARKDEVRQRDKVVAKRGVTLPAKCYIPHRSLLRLLLTAQQRTEAVTDMDVALSVLGGTKLQPQCPAKEGGRDLMFSALQTKISFE